MKNDAKSIDQLFFKYATQFSRILLVLDENGCIEHIHSDITDLFTDSQHQLMGKNWLEYCVPQHAYKKAMATFTLLMQSTDHQVEHHVYPILGSGKKERTISWYSIPKFNDKKQVIGIWMAGFDTNPNDLAHYEKELLIKRNTLAAQTILDHAVEGIITMDDQGLITSCNHAAENLFGYSSNEVIGKNVKMLMPPPYQEEHDRYLHNYLTTGHKKIIGIGREVAGLHKNGSQFPMELSVAEVHVESEQSFIGIIRDITERKQAEEQLRLRDQELQLIRDRMAHMDRLNVMGEMASGIAHELNQPLTAIATYAQASSRLLDMPLNNKDDLTHSLIQINEQAQRAGEVIRRLRAMITKQAPSRQRVDLKALILEAIELAKNDNRMKGIVTKTHFLDKSLTVEIDSIQIQQVILNLIRNAIDAIDANTVEQNKQIIIKTEQNDDLTRIAVIDSGPGLMNINTEEAFNPFASTKAHGMGMGLAISQSIVLAHEGTIGFNTDNKHGTEFYFTLPLAHNF